MEDCAEVTAGTMEPEEVYDAALRNPHFESIGASAVINLLSRYREEIVDQIQRTEEARHAYADSADRAVASIAELLVQHTGESRVGDMARDALCDLDIARLLEATALIQRGVAFNLHAHFWKLHASRESKAASCRPPSVEESTQPTSKGSGSCPEYVAAVPSAAEAPSAAGGPPSRDSLHGQRQSGKEALGRRELQRGTAQQRCAADTEGRGQAEQREEHATANPRLAAAGVLSGALSPDASAAAPPSGLASLFEKDVAPAPSGFPGPAPPGQPHDRGAEALFLPECRAPSPPECSALFSDAAAGGGGGTPASPGAGDSDGCSSSLSYEFEPGPSHAVQDPQLAGSSAAAPESRGVVTLPRIQNLSSVALSAWLSGSNPLGASNDPTD